jgi:hypothetical protein
MPNGSGPVPPISRPAGPVLWHRVLMRISRASLILVLGLTSTACFQVDTLVRLRADGSGTIEQRVLFTAAALDQMKQLGSLGGNGADFDPLSEDNAKAMAADLGPGVSYVSSTPLKTPEGEGRTMIYAFKDIRQVQVSQQPPGADALGGSRGFGFALARQPNSNVVLTIHMPPSGGLPGAGPGGTPPLPSPDQMTFVKQLLAGAHVAIAVEPAGRLVKTNSPYVDGNRVTLLDLDLDRLLGDDATLAKLQAAKDSADAQAILAGVPGIKIVTGQDISIEFAP